MRDYKNQKLKKGYGENMKKKVLCLVAIFVLMMGCLVGCDIEFEADGTSQDKMTTQEVASKLANNQPTPTDIDYSLERYNLIKRAYWVNGQREKANTLPCEIEKPLGYIVLFTESGSIIGSFVVDGKVSSLNSYLSPDSEAYTGYENSVDYIDQKIDDVTNYDTKKKVEDTCRTMISSYESDKLTYEQYKDSDNEEKQSWAEQAKMRANKTASTYNNYILENSYIWSGNVPADIATELEYIE